MSACRPGCKTTVCISKHSAGHCLNEQIRCGALIGSHPKLSDQVRRLISRGGRDAGQVLPCYSAPAHLQRAGGVRGRSDIVSDKQHTSTVGDILTEVAEHNLGIMFVQIPRRFVGQYYFGPIQDGASDSPYAASRRY